MLKILPSRPNALDVPADHVMNILRVLPQIVAILQGMLFLSSFKLCGFILTLNLLTWTEWWAPASASKWQMGFNSAFKGLTTQPIF